MTLYRVWVDYITYVVAETAEEAAAIAEQHAQDDLREHVWAARVRARDVISPEWRDAIPWGDDGDDRTVADYVAKLE